MQQKANLLDKQNVVYPHHGILLSHEKGLSTDTCYALNLKNIILGERNQTHFINAFI